LIDVAPGWCHLKKQLLVAGNPMNPDVLTPTGAPTHRAVATAVLFALFSGCGSAPAPKPPKPSVVQANLQATASANPDLKKRASPLVVRVFELKSAAAFEAADFLSLYERDQATLTSEMVSREEFVLRPGETRPWSKTVAGEVRYIGVIGAFRDIEHARWKAIVPIQANTTNRIFIKADNIVLTATTEVQP
jgi:type VI secretion system protein VasD